MSGTPCFTARRTKPLRELRMTYSSSGCADGFGYPSNISAIPPGAKPILDPSDKARSTEGREASLMIVRGCGKFAVKQRRYIALYQSITYTAFNQETMVRRKGNRAVAVATTGRNFPKTRAANSGRIANPSANGKIPCGVMAKMA